MARGAAACSGQRARRCRQESIPIWNRERLTVIPGVAQHTCGCTQVERLCEFRKGFPCLLGDRGQVTQSLSLLGVLCPGDPTSCRASEGDGGAAQHT
jgi:hypothetical protein